MGKSSTLEKQLLTVPDVEQVLFDLRRLPEMVVRVRRAWWQIMLGMNNGWLEVFYSDPGEINIWWRTHREHHNIRSSASIIITIDKYGRLICMKETARKLWITWTPHTHGTEEDLARALKFATSSHKELTRDSGEDLAINKAYGKSDSY